MLMHARHEAWKCISSVVALQSPIPGSSCCSADFAHPSHYLSRRGSEPEAFQLEQVENR